MFVTQKDFLRVQCGRCQGPATVDVRNATVAFSCGICFNKLDRVEDTLKGMADVVQQYAPANSAVATT